MIAYPMPIIPQIMPDEALTPVKVQLKLDGTGPQLSVEDSAEAFSSPFPLHHRFESNKGTRDENGNVQPKVSDFTVVPQQIIPIPVAQTQ